MFQHIYRFNNTVIAKHLTTVYTHDIIYLIYPFKEFYEFDEKIQFAELMNNFQNNCDKMWIRNFSEKIFLCKNNIFCHNQNWSNGTLIISFRDFNFHM